MVPGITPNAIIWTIIIALRNSGKNISTINGEKITPRNDIKIETMNVIFFKTILGFPLASCGTIY